MKKALNLLVLSAFLTTSIPFNVSYAAVEDSQDAETIEVPAEAVDLSERLIAENPGAGKMEEGEGPSCIKSGVAYSPKMTKAQRKELFVHGTITDCDGNIWNIKVIPGSDASKQMTIKSWRYAGKKAKQLIQIDTYKNAAKDGGRFAKESFNFAKRSSKLLKKGIWDYMIVEGVYKDLLRDNARVWKNAGITVANLRGSFGWLFGAIYAGVLKPVTLTGVNVLKAAFHITEGAVILVGGIAGTAGGLVATVSSPIIVPVVEVLTPPLLAVGSILTTGSIIPGVVYVWNGTAWVTSQLSHVPDSETTIGGVTFVRLENPKQPVKPQVTVTKEDINNVVVAGIETANERTKQLEISTKQAEIKKQIEELQRQQDALNDQSYALRRARETTAAATAVNNLFAKEYTSELVIDQDIRALAHNDAKIRALVLDYAAKQNITLSETEIKDAIQSINASILALITK